MPRTNGTRTVAYETATLGIRHQWPASEPEPMPVSPTWNSPPMRTNHLSGSASSA